MRNPEIRGHEPFQKKELVLHLEDGQASKELINILSEVIDPEAADQLVYSLKQTLMTGADYTNQCNEAVHAFGKSLDTHYADDEESFWELTGNNPTFFDTRTHSRSLDRIQYNGDFHSVARIELTSHQTTTQVIIDPTYGDVSARATKGTVLCIVLQGPKEAVMKELHNHYGGTWKDEFAYQHETGSYQWIEGNNAD